MFRFAICVCFVLSAAIADAKPLITSSEETVAGICLAREDTPERLVDACDAALSGAGLTASQRVELMVARADAFLWLDDLEAAEAGYRDATEADPRSFDAWNGLGWVLRETADDEAAFEAFETSLGIDVSVQGLGGRAATSRTTGRMTGEEAREILRAALTIDPEYSWALREIGWSLIDDSEPGLAADAFREALDIDSDDANARFGLGRALLSSGEADEALAIFNEVLAGEPDHFSSRVFRIITLRELDRNAQALRDSDRLIEEFPDMASGYIERGLSLMALQRRTEAIENYVRAEEVLGEKNSILYWHADALATDGQFSAALVVIDRALGLSGADYTDHLLKSYIALELEDYEVARAAAEASLETGVEDPWAHYYVAITLVHSGQTAEGLGRFDLAMETGLPEDRVGAFARELISAGKYVEAVQLRLKY